MKQYKTTIISLIIIVCAIAAFFIVSSLMGGSEDPAPASPTPEETKSEKLFDVDSVTDILRYECNMVDNIVLERVGDEWTCPSYEDVTLEDVNVSASLNIVRQSLAVPVYEGEITSEILDTYDISSTEYVRLELKDGRVFTLRFGMQKPGTASYFAVVEEKNKVYLVTGTYKNSVTITKENLIHTKIFDFNDSGKIKKIEVQKSGEIFFSVSADTSGESRTWSMTYPLERQGDDTHIEEVISSVTSLYTAKYIEGDCEDLSVYGLAVPYYVLEITDNKGTQTLSLGSKVPEGDAYYCIFGNTKNVFTVSTDSITFVDDTVIKYMNTYIFNPMYTELEHVTIDITCGDIKETYTLGFDIWDDGEQLYFNENPLPDDNTVIRAFRRMNTAIYMLDIADIDGEPETKGELLISVKYKMSSGETVVVEGFRRDETTMYLYENGVYSGGCEYIRQITGSNDSYGILGTIENFKSISGMS